MRHRLSAVALAMLCISCAKEKTAENGDFPEETERTAIGAENLSGNDATGDIGAPLSNRSSIDLRSPEGAAQVLRDFAALLEQGRLVDAGNLSEDELIALFTAADEIHADIGEPGRVEGAAGSLYVEIPIRFHGGLKDGKAFSRDATATLRRSNDVPGSTEQQRQWRIYRLEMQPLT